MKEYIFILDNGCREFVNYYCTQADNEKQAVVNLIDYCGGLNIFTPERLNQLIDSFDTFELIRMFESQHGKIIQFGEFNAIYGKPI